MSQHCAWLWFTANRSYCSEKRKQSKDSSWRNVTKTIFALAGIQCIIILLIYRPDTEEHSLHTYTVGMSASLRLFHIKDTQKKAAYWHYSAYGIVSTSTCERLCQAEKKSQCCLLSECTQENNSFMVGVWTFIKRLPRVCLSLRSIMYLCQWQMDL